MVIPHEDFGRHLFRLFDEAAGAAHHREIDPIPTDTEEGLAVPLRPGALEVEDAQDPEVVSHPHHNVPRMDLRRVAHRTRSPMRRFAAASSSLNGKITLLIRSWASPRYFSIAAQLPATSTFGSESQSRICRAW